MSALELPPSTDSVPVARQFARRAAGDSSADVETLLLLVSEVVTNAVLHARSHIRMDVLPMPDVVRVEVHDASPIEPRVHHFHLTSGTGRGLRMLEQLARRWGVDAEPGGGKVVWFEVGEADESAWQFLADDLLSEAAVRDL